MFQKLIQTICKLENLIDVGNKGIASQSSLSKWSKENDATRALLPLIKNNFAFHTDKQDFPWWQGRLNSNILYQ